MRKVAPVFVLAVFVPSLALARLAVRSLRDQEFIPEGPFASDRWTTTRPLTNLPAVQFHRT